LSVRPTQADLHEGVFADDGRHGYGWGIHRRSPFPPDGTGMVVSCRFLTGWRGRRGIGLGARREPRDGVSRLEAGSDGEAPPGFEPGNHGFAIRCLQGVKPISSRPLRLVAPPVAAQGKRAAPDDPDLALVVSRWLSLPESVRRIVELAEAGGK
jgi:hypothetical protein